ncbi:DUF305 domain-containing protein [Streptomyces niger]|uniref:DUF305 domain-containing protein n=1 Tax=Streptomyces niger TaxID=66373 RepID=UPI00069A6473|nr:DUF305 domain-containing protein [Streptomyces niger]
MQRSRRAALAIVAAATVAILGAGGCSAGGGGAADAAAGDAGQRVIAPGKPGEPARTLSADEARKETDDDSPNSADFAYVQMMIEHHQQALVMTALAKKHAAAASVKRLADRIDAAQRPEIDAMKGWLDSHGGPREQQGHAGHEEHDGHGGHDEAKGHGEHGEGSAAMPGMATEAQLDKLRAARGKGFDELFLTLMITHHQGAVTMATDALSDGNNVRVEEMATDVIAQQTAEIGRMRKLTP